MIGYWAIPFLLSLTQLTNDVLIRADDVCASACVPDSI